VNRAGADESAVVVLERQAERVTRAMIAIELFLVLHVGAGRRHRLREQPEDRLHEIVADTRAKTAARATEGGIRLLQIGIAHCDAVQLDGVPTHSLGFGVESAIAILKKNSCDTSWLTTDSPIFAGLKRMKGSASRTALVKSGWVLSSTRTLMVST